MTKPEGPEEINPLHIAKNVRAEVLLKEPMSYTVDESGTKTFLVPDATLLEWSQVPFIIEPENCSHGFSICEQCADEWAIDHYVKYYQDGKLVSLSEDHPDRDSPTEK